MIQLVVFMGLVLLGLIVGQASEQAHLANLRAREKQMAYFTVTDIKTFPEDVNMLMAAQIVVAEAVIATDYLKTLLASLRNLFGGEVRSLQTLMQRARREALLRLKEQAAAGGYNAICNLRLESADIGGLSTRRGVPMASILASGTAFQRHAGTP